MNNPVSKRVERQANARSRPYGVNVSKTAPPRTCTARDLLEHHPARIIADLTSHHEVLVQDGKPAPGLKRCIDDLTAKRPYLIYRIALAMGWPIATGVIEGTCRYLVKDRLAITGARWILPGAEAVHLLRAVITNGDFPAYWEFHLQREQQRTHTSRYQRQYDGSVARTVFLAA